jgi:hypothetical protein
MSQRVNKDLLYGLVDPFLDIHKWAIIFIHHPPKVKVDKTSQYSLLYSGAGDATLANWPRASLFVWPRGEKKMCSSSSLEREPIVLDGRRRAASTKGAMKAFSGCGRPQRM